MLDIGCSFGMGSAFVKYGCSFDEMVAFFSTRAPRDLYAACEAMRAWINVTPTPYDVRCVGIDSSKPAIHFAMRAGLLDGGISRDFEDPEINPNTEELSWLRSCNLLISTGAIGYVTDRTMTHVVREAGKDHPSEFGPLALLTILRIFDDAPIGKVFKEYGYRFEKVPGIMLPQRRFADEVEQKSVLKILHDKGLDTGGWEDQGKQFAELFIAAKPDDFPEFFEKMKQTHSVCAESESENTTYICR
jgi:carnitine O-acetyltransferase